MPNLPLQAGGNNMLIMDIAFDIGKHTVNAALVDNNTECMSCIVMILRADWDNTSLTFTAADTYPAREVYVCQWSSVVARGVKVGSVVYNGTIYD